MWGRQQCQGECGEPASEVVLLPGRERESVLRRCAAVSLTRRLARTQIWLVTPRPLPQAASLSLPLAPSSSAANKPIPKSNPNPDPSVEYLATLSQHQGVVNCVRWSPKGA